MIVSVVVTGIVSVIVGFVVAYTLVGFAYSMAIARALRW